jgi:hypothetical protein
VAADDRSAGPGVSVVRANVAARLGMNRPGVALEIVGVEVRDRLEADGGHCLIVFDNATDPDAAALPALGGPRAAVITSADSTAAGRGDSLSVGVFTEAESLGFLTERTGCGDPDGAADLAGELGHLPLVLAQAAAVIAAQRLTYAV